MDEDFDDTPEDDSDQPIKGNIRDKSPTETVYDELQRAYTFFNTRLFEGRLPGCLFTVSRKRNAFGYFWGERFFYLDGNKEPADEIALNFGCMAHRPLFEVLSTLVHEMVHQEQQHYGTLSKSPGYHNKEWGWMMKSVGLFPSNTGMPGGKQTGVQMTHFVMEGGPFEQVTNELIETGFKLSLAELTPEIEPGDEPGDKKKVKYSCPNCDAKLWGKPALAVFCPRCDVFFEDEDGQSTELNLAEQENGDPAPEDAQDDDVIDEWEDIPEEDEIAQEGLETQEMEAFSP